MGGEAQGGGLPSTSPPLARGSARVAPPNPPTSAILLERPRRAHPGESPFRRPGRYLTARSTFSTLVDIVSTPRWCGCAHIQVQDRWCLQTGRRHARWTINKEPARTVSSHPPPQARAPPARLATERVPHSPPTLAPAHPAPRSRPSHGAPLCHSVPSPGPGSDPDPSGGGRSTPRSASDSNPRPILELAPPRPPPRHLQVRDAAAATSCGATPPRRSRRSSPRPSRLHRGVAAVAAVASRSRSSRRDLASPSPRRRLAVARRHVL